MNTGVQAIDRTVDRSASITASSAELLRNLFLHHDGIVVGATVSALAKGGVLAHLFEHKQVSMQALRDRAGCRSGYLHVALRCLALQGWLERSGEPAADEMQFQVTGRGELAAVAFDTYARVADFIYSGVTMEDYLFDPDSLRIEAFRTYAGLIDECRQGWGLPTDGQSGETTGVYELVARQLDGMLIAPFMIAAKQHDLLDGDRVPLERVRGSTCNLEICLQLLEYLGWVEHEQAGWRYTSLGRLAADFSLHYGLTGSYFPMFSRLYPLIFDADRHVTHVQPGKEESHVDRVVNVLASGVAHRRYFEDSEAMIVDLFNQLPLSRQPRFVADMGCGDGEWLKRIYEVVCTRTERGRHLREYPLLMIGADYNVTAQAVVRDKLDKAGVPSLVLFGDVGDPERFSRDLAAHGIDIREGLHVRAFIDHNRPYKAPLKQPAAAEARSTGAYADEDGNAIDNRQMEQSLCEHLAKWVPYTGRHGLIILEAHDVDPQTARFHPGQTHATAFDTYHGYSNQYPVDFEAFMEQAENAGLRAVIFRQILYPSRLPFVAISLNHFKTDERSSFSGSKGLGSPLRSDWAPVGDEDHEDGNALHHLLYRDGDLSRPMRWCCYSTGLLVAEIIAVIEQRWDQIRSGRTSSRRITVVDYGAGTGFATLELIRALEEKGFPAQFAEAGVEFSLCVCDFPSGWFAKAFELMRACDFVSFFSLKNVDSGGIRLVSELFEPESVDLVFASMVFHLIPPSAFSPLAGSFDRILRPGGVVLWNTPDTVPALSNSDVIHHGNRLLRQRLLELLQNREKWESLIDTIPRSARVDMAKLADRVVDEYDRLSAEQRAGFARAAGRQILPRPTARDAIVSGFDRFSAQRVWQKLSVITDEELMALALLPANQRNAGEIVDRDDRQAVIRLLMQKRILPLIHQSPAGLQRGMVLSWTFGRHVKPV